MNRKYSLKKTKDIDRVFHLKKSVGSRYYAIYVGPGTTKLPQLAISISKRCGNAVVRNYEKRVVRELVRPYLEKLNHHHYLIIVKKSVIELLFTEKKVQMEKLLNKITTNKENN
ncbi:MAG: ribonuclease P protein component [Bacilli bacterium]